MHSVDCQLFVLIARPRSGTTALRSLLEGRSDLHVYGEIFDDKHIRKTGYFFNFYKEQLRRRATLALPSEGNRRFLFQKYIDELQLKAIKRGRHRILVSANYN